MCWALRGHPTAINHMTDLRALITELANELDHNRQCLLDDRRLTHPLADKARAELAEPADGEVAELVLWLREEADDYDFIEETLASLKCRRAADLLERLSSPQPIPVAERLPGPGKVV